MRAGLFRFLSSCPRGPTFSYGPSAYHFEYFEADGYPMRRALALGLVGLLGMVGCGYGGGESVHQERPRRHFGFGHFGFESPQEETEDRLNQIEQELEEAKGD